MMTAPCAPERAGASTWPAALILWGTGAKSSPHSHHCFQVYLALSGTIRARSGPDTLWRRSAAVLVAPDVPHEIDASDGQVVIGFFDPESEFAASLWTLIGDGITLVSDAVAAGWRSIVGDATQIDKTRVDRWAQTELLRERRMRPLHPGVQRVVNYLRDGGLQEGQLSAKDLAGIAQLSPSRFLHVFSESLRIPFRSYVRWLRVQRAMGALAAGSSITEAAHVGGFSDAAHLTRTLRRTLGHTPGELVKRCVLRGEIHRTTAG
ncbi:MAG TPA: AraC family transcriptional regulator [Vicinamibacterales bacterium]|nr:AraC family transcriptional regulator [Vicinamibacterales bacterium]